MFLKTYKKATALLFIFTILAIPAITFATTEASFPIIKPKELDISVTSILNGVFNVIWPLVVAAVIISFLWAGITFLMAQGDPGKVSQARTAVLWAIAGVAVILLSASAITLVNNLITPGGGGGSGPQMGCSVDGNGEGVCIEGGEGGACSSNADCAGPKACGESAPQCNGTCPGGKTCKNAVGSCECF